MPGKGLMERLADGVVIGDGGYVTIMEKRGYARIGVWTPEATVEHPEAGTASEIEEYFKILQVDPARMNTSFSSHQI